MRLHDHTASRQALADVVVGLAREFHRDAVCEERAETLACRTLQFYVDGVVGQTVVAESFCDFARQHRADGAIQIAYTGLNGHALAFFERRFGAFDQHIVKCVHEAVVLRFAVMPRHFFRHIRHMENTREIEALGFPMGNTLARIQQVGTADEVIEFANTHTGHQLAHFFRDKEEKIHHVFWLPGKLFA